MKTILKKIKDKNISIKIQKTFVFYILQKWLYSVNVSSHKSNLFK